MPSPDGAALAVVTYEAGGWTVGADGPRSETGAERWDGVEPDRWKPCWGWSPDGIDRDRRLADRRRNCGTRDGEPSGGARAASAGFVLSVDFTLDGSPIVTGATDGTIRLFDATTWKQLGANIPAPITLGIRTRAPERRGARRVAIGSPLAVELRSPGVGRPRVLGREPDADPVGGEPSSLPGTYEPHCGGLESPRSRTELFRGRKADACDMSSSRSSSSAVETSTSWGVCRSLSWSRGAHSR